jgi:hypothetical protein
MIRWPSRPKGPAPSGCGARTPLASKQPNRKAKVVPELVPLLGANETALCSSEKDQARPREGICQRVDVNRPRATGFLRSPVRRLLVPPPHPALNATTKKAIVEGVTPQIVCPRVVEVVSPRPPPPAPLAAAPRRPTPADADTEPAGAATAGVSKETPSGSTLSASSLTSLAPTPSRDWTSTFHLHPCLRLHGPITIPMFSPWRRTKRVSSRMIRWRRTARKRNDSTLTQSHVERGA